MAVPYNRSAASSGAPRVAPHINCPLLSIYSSPHLITSPRMATKAKGMLPKKKPISTFPHIDKAGFRLLPLELSSSFKVMMIRPMMSSRTGKSNQLLCQDAVRSDSQQVHGRCHQVVHTILPGIHYRD